MGILVTCCGFWASKRLEICLAHVLASLSIDTNAVLSINSPSSPRQLHFARQTDHPSIADLFSLLSSSKLRSEIDFEFPSSGVHQDLVNVLGWEDAGVERQNLSGSEFELFCPIPKVVSIDAWLMMSIGAQLLMSVDTSTSCLWTCSFRLGKHLLPVFPA
ncbi:hypothetical protein F2Q69_00035349 [Brassica cretica]|uniref:Uncharacterized protein n=1 Tax=Brassica cretica TaxID=69181 RepID=A0A8S9SMX1_BRACR|nr:hypothetical protein F2Q69_00035349 [Brassica cretica]